MAMYFKIAGGILIFVAASGVGFLMADDINERLNNLLALKNIMINLKGEFRYNKCILSEALKTTGRRTSSSFKKFLLKTSELIENEKSKNVEEIWNNSLDKYVRGKVVISNKDLINLRQLGSNLGNLDLELQMSAIDYFLDNLEGETKQLMCEKDKKIKLYRTLGIMAGIFTVIILF